MIKRIFVKKKEQFDIESLNLKNEIKNFLGIKLSKLNIFYRYDIEGLSESDYKKVLNNIFKIKKDREIFEEEIEEKKDKKYLVVGTVLGQYDQEADFLTQYIKLSLIDEPVIVRLSKVYEFSKIKESEFSKIKDYLINPVEKKIGDCAKPDSLSEPVENIEKVPVITGFINYDKKELKTFYIENAFAMSFEDMLHIQKYFSEDEKRDPTETELKVLDTYWSDHCRHTTFNTELTAIKVDSENPHIQIALDKYNELYKLYNGNREDKYKSLMDIATIGAKHLRKIGKLKNLDISDEINACSIEVDVDNDGTTEKWLIMFKNETHNHPTEIEPFGGASTCLGGAIRDPLSGRVYVYQAMRVTAAADPRTAYDKTLSGKLPQRVLTQKATEGYSSYGNQIGLAAGLSEEIYHNQYVAKRMECGFVIGGAKKENVVRQKPQKGDAVIMLGGDTGRDGCGGATGSSKAHNVEASEKHGAEVQKGNPLVERNIQRFFKRNDVSTKIIKCNDFGAGGVSVAIGELADSLDINLDLVPVKYKGLTGTELAISESQERMAVITKAEDVDEFIKFAKEENLNAVKVANVTDSGYMRMYYRGDLILNLKRTFLETNGVTGKQKVVIADKKTNYFNAVDDDVKKSLDRGNIKEAVLQIMSKLNVCSQKGMQSYFDSTVGGNTIYLPLGGEEQITPNIAIAAKVPTTGKTNTATVAAYGCRPYLLESSPFIGATYSVVESLSKLIASGVELDTIYLTFQEYFKKLGNDAERWGTVTSALLGALQVQLEMGVGAIGGKDSMSGTFENIDVPSTLISFAVGIANANELITNVFENNDKYNSIYHIKIPRDKYGMVDFEKLRELYSAVSLAIKEKKILAANVVGDGGAISALIKSALGNNVGLKIKTDDLKDLFKPAIGDIVIQAQDNILMKYAKKLGNIEDVNKIKINKSSISLNTIKKSYTQTLENIFPTKVKCKKENIQNLFMSKEKDFIYTGIKLAKPRVLIPVLPGGNSDIDIEKAFRQNGALTKTLVFKNNSLSDIEDSIKKLAQEIKNSQILVFQGGCGDFTAVVFQNQILQDALDEMLNRDSLVLGVGNGFNALVDLGLLPFGKIENNKTCAFIDNTIGHFQSSIARVRVASNKTPWFNNIDIGDVFLTPIAHDRGRFVCDEKEFEELMANGQIATQFVDMEDNATNIYPYNPTGSFNAIEGLISKDGKILGKIGHIERVDSGIYKNLCGDYDMKIFKSGVEYFTK